jgi:outer membrane protein TolC
VQRLKDDVAVSVERAYNKLERTKTMIEVAREVVSLRQESERLATNEFTQGIVHVSERRQAVAASYKAQADLPQASLGYLLAHAELENFIGHTPGL